MTQQHAEGPSVPALSLGDRLRLALRHAGVSREEMSEELTYSPATLSRYMNDEIEPRASVLTVWAWRCNVPLEWLRTGEAGSGGGGGPKGDKARRPKARSPRGGQHSGVSEYRLVAHGNAKLNSMPHQRAA